jgi:S-DNA-T family DNA segregation ATPase FtsK/SpoIIIE
MREKFKIQLIGWLLALFSFLIVGAILTYDFSEDPNLFAKEIKNPFGITGIYIGYYLVKLGFGYGSLLIPAALFSLSIFLISNKKISLLGLLQRIQYELIFLFLISITLGFIENVFLNKDTLSFQFSGYIGGIIFSTVFDWLGAYGSLSALIFTWFLILQSIFRWDFKKLYQQFFKTISSIKIPKVRIPEIKISTIKNKSDSVVKKSIIDDNQFKNDILKTEVELTESIKKQEEFIEDHFFNDEDKIPSPNEEDIEVIENNINIEKGIVELEADIDESRTNSFLFKDWKFPSTDLLLSENSSENDLNDDELKERSDFLKISLSNFGVEGETGSIKTGPVITLFELEPAQGVRVNKFVQLSDDIARVMEAKSVRIIAPIPGTNLVGVEIPNKNPQTIYLKSVINSEKYLNSRAKLKLAIGKGTLGEISILDLTEMPHLLIAGTTGSGKSVSLNTIIVSLLYQLKPDEVKFVIIDPKKVEMSLYKGLEKHYLLKFDGIDESIITKKDNAILALRSLEKQMDTRYDILAEAGKRNIDEYNQEMKKAKKEIMPYIILMIDELADLMMYSPRDVETPIARLAQLARAVGIHLIVATQRPSVDVITGVIKANFPARIAFQVATRIDSRTILDEIGADKLIGKGDMLYQKPGSSSPIRMHGAFVTLKEIEDLVSHIANQPEPNELIIETVKSDTNSSSNLGDSIEDELLTQAIELVVTNNQGSISLLQRRLSIGYSRAARLIDEMERLKIVGPFTGSKAREVLVDESYLEMIDE